MKRILFVFVGMVLVGGMLGAPPMRGGLSGVLACLSKGCDMDSGPVCAVDDTGLPRTFENRCMADLAYCKFGIYYAVVKPGEC